MRLLASVTSACLLAGCALSSDSDSTVDTPDHQFGITRVQPEDREPAPVIEGEDLYGEPFTSAPMRGKTIVVTVWGSWCAPCRAEAPVLAEVSSEHADEDVEFIGINVRDDATAARRFNRRYDITYPSVSDIGGENLLGFNSSLPAAVTPTTWIIDARGRVAVRIMTDELSSSLLSGLIDDVQSTA